ncbi:hypothetical protein [Larkinella soli]|uniref:hypothetical protein n=1 Tax=Larkinella soli TaxID=1770527 RepID=UPI000FFC1D4C|nr:hypothetical protein [Larkinella soli]
MKTNESMPFSGTDHRLTDASVVAFKASNITFTVVGLLLAFIFRFEARAQKYPKIDALFTGPYVHLASHRNPDANPEVRRPNLLVNRPELRVHQFPNSNPLLFKLLIENHTQRNLVLTLKNANHDEIYQDFIGRRQSWSWWRFNLEQLSVGKYTLHIQWGGQKAVYEFAIEANRPVLTPERTLVFTN